MRPTVYSICILLVLPLTLAACGGGGGGNNNNNNNAQQVTIPSTASLDGGIVFNNALTTDTASASLIPQVGDGPFLASGGTLRYQGLWSFDLSGLPANATITSATLRLFVSGIGNDPDGAFVQANVDHVNFGATFPTSSGGFVNLANAFAIIADMNTIGERLVDVATEVQNDLDGARTRAQFRVRTTIASDLDAQADFSIFSDQDNTPVAANRPMLILEFTTP